MITNSLVPEVLNPQVQTEISFVHKCKFQRNLESNFPLGWAVAKKLFYKNKNSQGPKTKNNFRPYTLKRNSCNNFALKQQSFWEHLSPIKDVNIFKHSTLPNSKPVAYYLMKQFLREVSGKSWKNWWPQKILKMTKCVDCHIYTPRLRDVCGLAVNHTHQIT